MFSSYQLVSPWVREALEHAVTLSLVVQGAKCKGMWWHWVQRGVMPLWLGLPGFTASTTVWSLAGSADGPQCLQGLLECSAALAGPAAGDQGRRWWWPEQAVCAHLTAGVCAGACVAVGAVCRHTWWLGQGMEQGPGPTMRSLAATGVHYCDCWVSAKARGSEGL